MRVFDLDNLLTECRAALADDEPRLATRDVLRRALSRPDEVADAMQPTEGGITLLHHAPDLTVIDVVWAPAMHLYPHDHRMWAVIGIYTGREDNVFYRRAGANARTLAESGGKRLAQRDVLVLGDDVVHSVANTGTTLAGAIHVYGGDFVNQPRSQWGPGPLEERPFDFDETNRQFEEANRAWRDASTADGH